MAENRPHYRHELKFLINAGDRELLARRLDVLMRRDPHAPEGGYKIRSLYFDDYWHTAYGEKLMGVTGRKKYRIRFYDDNDAVIKLECKSKQDSYIYKRAVPLSREEVDRILRGDYAFLLGRKEPLCGEFYVQLTARMLRPRVIIDYERTPFVMEAGDGRVTFDENVRACSGGEKLFDPRLPMLYLLEPGKLVLEVKFTEFLPDLVRRALPPRSSELTAVSKFVLGCEKTGYLYAESIHY